MELTRWEPGTLANRLLDEMWSPFPFTGRTTVRPFEADVLEVGDEIRVTAELPGVNHEKLDVTLESNVLTISGEKTHDAEPEEDGRYHLMERRWGRFSRSFALPRSVEPDEVHATFEEGILTVRIPKTEEARRRRISIGTGGQRQLSEATG